MKQMIKILALGLISISLFSLSGSPVVTAAEPIIQDEVLIGQTFREPKNIAFAGGVSGSSQYNWVLSIMDELAERGHNTTFFIREDGLRLVKPYPKISAVSIGDPYPIDREAIAREDPDMARDFKRYLPFIINVFSSFLEKDYKLMVDMIKEYKIDVILCDHFFDPCVYAATNANIPFIITSITDITKDSSAPYINSDFISMQYPTTETQTIWDRFNKKFILPLQFFKILKPQIMAIRKMKEELGIHVSSDQTTAWRDSIKLINNVFGLMAARPTGSLVQVVGPIMPKKYKPLDGDLKEFLDNHKRVAYISFGHVVTPNKGYIQLLLSSIMETIESGDLDGFIWATVNSKVQFPEYVTTSSNTKYSVSDMFDNKSTFVRLVKWAPQTAILFHPSLYIFISHGGFNSWVESLYAGKRIVMFPFFGDQPVNAILNEHARAGGIIDPSKSVEETADYLRNIIRDQDGEIAKGVKRFQSLVQIYSSHGILHGADTVEEVAFVNVDSKLPHRYPASRNMNYFKARNLDIYGLLAAIILGSFATFYYISKMLFNILLSNTASKQKKE